MSVLLTIGITSYNRINELVRCINSIQTKYSDEIEVLVSEDNSPQSALIESAVKELAETSSFSLRFSRNEVNLGYDMNLGAIIKHSNGQYIFFMSDDDIIYKGCLDNIIEYLKKTNRPNELGVLYAPFVYSESLELDRNHEVEHDIEASEKNAAKYLYDSILFSGLIFNRSYVEKLDSSRFKNYNYFQVYMFLEMIYKYGGHYFKQPSVVCVGDGENAYGISESSGGNEILANRKSVKSNLEFNKTLFKVIRLFDSDNQTDVFSKFQKQYSLHSYSGLSIARRQGIKYYREYWKILKSLDIKLYPVSYCYYFILLLFGQKISDWLFSGFRLMLRK